MGGFEHRPASLGHQQTNGKAEATVKEAKRLLRKAKETKGDPYLDHSPMEEGAVIQPFRLEKKVCHMQGKGNGDQTP